MGFFLQSSLDLSGEFYCNEHFWVETILKCPKISLMTKYIIKLLRINIISGPELKPMLKLQNEAMYIKAKPTYLVI